MPEEQSSCRSGPGITSFDLVGVWCPDQDLAQFVSGVSANAGTGANHKWGGGGSPFLLFLLCYYK